MNKKILSGFTLVEILVVVGILALLVSIAIPHLLRARITANESATRANLHMISTALETYALTNGTYPPNTTALIGQSPPYLALDYFSGLYSGYGYVGTLAPYAYSVVATPASSSQGTAVYTVVTGGVLTSNP